MQWNDLIVRASASTVHAYAPYSGQVAGAAAVVADGRVVLGCNVENAIHGLTLCAECSLISQLRLTGGGRLTQFVCVDGLGQVTLPCGRCRELLWEHAGPELRLMTPQGERTLAEVLPDGGRERAAAGWGPGAKDNGGHEPHRPGSDN
ncbi:MAG: cytidine deaminase [Bifidobacteriaceae bacterium]|jgi:cytidine deaminase|nr:cytidine deaminase [Bifidobacteriaceae bacterium]